MNPATVVVVSGRIGSGKTTFSQALADSLSVLRIGFGDEVRARAAALGLGDTREAWQKLGERLVAEQPREFCTAVLARGGYQAGVGIVIEGVRHAEILPVVRSLVAPERVKHVHISSADADRLSRVQERGRMGEASLARADQHSTEIQLVDRLPAMADFVVDGSMEVSAMVAAVTEWLAKPEK